MNITARKQQERALAENQERYQAVVQKVPGYVFELRPSPDGLAAIAWASEGLKHVFGCDLEEYRRRGGWRAFWRTEDHARVRENLQQLLRGQASECQWQVRDTRGRLRWLHVFYKPFNNQSDGLIDTIFGVAHDITDRVELERKFLEAANREQQRIARDLHDGLGQELTGIALLLQSLATRLRAVAPRETKDLAYATSLVNEAIENTRSLAYGLAPVSADPGALPAALRALAQVARKPRQLKITVRAGALSRIAVPTELATHLYRIVQEAITNAVRHGHARRIEIRLAVGAHRSTLTVTDDGCGIENTAEQAQGMGLRTMAHRARMIDGELRIQQPRQGGTRVVCGFRIPVQPLNSRP